MNIVVGEGSRALPVLPYEVSNAERIAYERRYPGGLDLKPGSEAHQRIVTKLMAHACASERIMSQRHLVWRELDRNLCAYVPTATVEAGAEVQKTQKVIIVPALYALLDVMYSNLVAAFLSDEPIYRYRWTGEEDMIGAILLERVIAIKNRKAKAGLAIQTMLRDALVYGFGIVVPSWRVIKGQYVSKTIVEPSMLQTMLSAITGRQPTKTEKRILKTGTVNEAVYLENVDPYLVLADPNKPIERCNDGEFIGWLRPDNLYNKLEQEKQYGEGYFNAGYLSKLTANYGRSIIFKDERADKSGIQRDSLNTILSKPMDDLEFQIRIIPADWGLGTSTSVERWRFVLTADLVLTCAHKLRYPFDTNFQAVVCAPEYDGHSAVPISRLEVNYGLQNFIDFSFSSHMENVKRMVNDMLVYDPSMVVAKDVNNPAPGKRIRLRRRAWGGDVNRAIQQLKITDYTQQNVADAERAMGWMEKFFGASEQSQGVIRTRGERVSATEARDTTLGGLRRTDRIAKTASMQAMYDLALYTAYVTQYEMEEGTWVDLTGRGEQILRTEFGDEQKQIYVSPNDLAIRTDVEPYDAISVLSEDPNAITHFLQLAGTNPELMAKLDMPRLFLHAARLFGFSNVQDFMRKEPIQTQVVPTEQANAGAQSGELTPIPMGIGDMLGSY